MSKITRRLFLYGASGFALAGTGIGSYAFAVEPSLCLEVTSYRVTPPGWTPGLRLKAAVLTDLHACEPWMPAVRIGRIAELTNTLQPDIVFLLGDFNGSLRFATTAPVVPGAWGEALSVLSAPLGVHAVLGNHDWLHGPLPDMPADKAEGVRRALTKAGSSVLENDTLRLTKDGKAFWLAGLGDQMALRRTRAGHLRTRDDLPGTLARIEDDAPIILLAHEPYVFKKVPNRVSLTLCGHTHGGQVNLPILDSLRPARDLTYGHIVENDRHLIVSAGIGMSELPIRFMRPPEIVMITIEAPPALTT
jgi:predicted MPP superfamily phosphohydrolase